MAFSEADIVYHFTVEELKVFTKSSLLREFYSQDESIYKFFRFLIDIYDSSIQLENRGLYLQQLGINHFGNYLVLILRMPVQWQFRHPEIRAFLSWLHEDPYIEEIMLKEFFIDKAREERLDREEKYFDNILLNLENRREKRVFSTYNSDVAENNSNNFETQKSSTPIIIEELIPIWSIMTSPGDLTMQEIKIIEPVFWGLFTRYPLRRGNKSAIIPDVGLNLKEYLVSVRKRD